MAFLKGFYRREVITIARRAIARAETGTKASEEGNKSKMDMLAQPV